MKFASKFFETLFACIVLSGAALAATPTVVAHVSCDIEHTGYVNMSVYAYDMEITRDRSIYFLALYVDDSHYGVLAARMYGNLGFTECLLSTNPAPLTYLKIISVEQVGVGAGVGAGPVGQDSVGQNYTQVFMESEKEAGEGPSVSSVTLTPEAKEKAFEDFRARTSNLLRR